jgi:AcrR family transcriptional regulator
VWASSTVNVVPVSTRSQKALATRQRMVRAAYRLFCAEGYLGTTMKAVADEAGVAVQTLYYTFHTKAALLDETVGAAVVGFDEWGGPPSSAEIVELLPWHPWWGAFVSAPSTRAALDVFVDEGVRILERVGPLVAAMHGGSGDAEAVVRIAEERRVRAYQEVVHLLARKRGGLRRGLGAVAATDLLVVLFSAEVYQALAVGRGWTRARCAKFFRLLLASQLLEEAPFD